MESAKLKMVAALSVLSLYSSGFAIDISNLPLSDQSIETSKVKIINNKNKSNLPKNKI